MIMVKEIKNALLQLVFPHICAGCGNDLPGDHSMLCLQCVYRLPETDFERYPDNPVEKKFWGRLPLLSASAGYYFTRESLMQQLMHEFKYRGNKDLGLQLGRMMAERLWLSGRFAADALIPLPLFASKERRRGYNQSTVLCQGMSEILRIPVLTGVVSRPMYTDTQTRKGRIERWLNIEGKFVLDKPDAIRDKTIILVDDVVTTGATLEACGTELLKAGRVNLHVAALCYAVQ